ncbi:hypothetical protein GND98_005125 [Clostridium butyricum]|uniref:Type II toxin-antitoxin system RelE/ParE family toxin n=1 Tax=Clostridium butyricum TaxID=1492 RepID=A0A6L9EKV6_CLOBU|nr:type II toxin-antitoxin system RelE/ParE family toxin [Clostridium butyricum]MDU5818945.1 type II toxin-antitoxin system RelE/ParE family toxin [Clostridium butyricum]NAS17263.1 hypothetical protein [Clostridium butyricum]
MDAIINDFSFEGQFEDTCEFLDSLHDCTLPMLTELEKMDMNILRSYNSYASKVTKDLTLNDLLITRGNPEITKLKGQLQKLFFEDPFWEENQMAIEDIYHCEHTDLESGYCLCEALERDIPVISFENEKFKNSIIKIKKNNNDMDIKNLYNKEIMLQILRENKNISHFQYIISKYSLNESFGLMNEKNYFSELVQSASLSTDDEEYIINDMEKLINFLNAGDNPGELSDTIDGKLKEFRTSLTNNRQIRFFYFEKNRKIIFLNGFLKKTQKTPSSEIEKAKRIMKMYYE